MTWMTSIVRYRCLDMLRHERLQPSLEDRPAHEPDTNPGSEPMQATLLSSETQALLRCMDKLDPRQRRSILLAYYGGYTHREIAHRMGAPVGTVKSWIRRSFERIKRMPRYMTYNDDKLRKRLASEYVLGTLQGSI